MTIDIIFQDKEVQVMGERSGSSRVLDSRQRGYGFESHQHHCAVSLSKPLIPCLVLVQPRKTHQDMTEKMLTGA